jgi:hypothetical protein
MKIPELDKRLESLFRSPEWGYISASFKEVRDDAMQGILGGKNEAEACTRIRLLKDLEEAIRASAAQVGCQVDPFIPPKEPA